MANSAPWIVSTDLLRQFDADAWGRVYDGLSKGLETAHELLKSELEAFRAQSGQHTMAMTSCRIKARDSFIDKMRRISFDEERLREVDGRAEVDLFDLITDLVGGRMVFYFEQDIREAVLFWMTYPTYYPTEITLWSQDSTGMDTRMIAAKRWIESVGNADQVSSSVKESGYESLHFIVGLNMPMLRAHLVIADKRHDPGKDARLNAMREQIEEHKAFLAKVRMEVQCQTILEHTWAQVEHRARYSLIKSRQNEQASSYEQKTAFRSYKAALRAAQIFQNGLQSAPGRWELEDATLAGRSTTLERHPRTRATGEVLEIIKALNRQINKTVESPSEDGWRNTLEHFQSTLEKLKAEGWIDSLYVTHTQDRAVYREKRLMLMLLGFIMTHGGVKVTERAAAMYLKDNVPEAARGWIAPALVVARLYEALLMLDLYFHLSGKEADPFFEDPLTNVRAGSVYFDHFGSLRRSSALLAGALRKLASCPQRNRSVVLSEQYILHRLAETSWAAFNLEGRAKRDLSDALQHAVAALTAGRYDEDEKDKRRVLDIEASLVAHILTMTLYEESERVPESALAGEHSWTILKAARARDEVCKVWDPHVIRWLENWKQELDERHSLLPPGSSTMMDEDRVLSSSQKKALKRQGVAIALAMSAAEAETKKQCDIYLVEARRVIRQARRSISDRVKSHRGGALPFHEDVVRQVEGLIYFLCTDERGDADALPAEASPPDIL